MKHKMNRREALKLGGQVAAGTVTGLSYLPELISSQSLALNRSNKIRISKSSPKKYIVTDYGAVGDGTTLNTKAIQRTIDAAASSDGGLVVIPEGRFLSGSISLKTGVSLYLNFNAVLLGSTNPFDYLSGNTLNHFINAENAKNIGILGKGIIDGQGRDVALNIVDLYYTGDWKEPNYNYRRNRSNKRPHLLKLLNCENILIEEITVKNPAFWVLDLERCNQLKIDNVTIDSDAYWNNDGIDIVDCQNVSITNCTVNSADDGICLKSHHPDHINDNIYIANCTIRSSASAIKFGTRSDGGFKNVKIENIFVYDTYRSSIALESVDGGVLENIEISNIKANNTGNAIFIKLGQRNQQDGEVTNKANKVGTVKNITIKNMDVQVPFDAPDKKYDIRGPKLPFFHNIFPASITGMPEHYVENVTLEDINIIYPGRANKGYAYMPVHRLDDVPENESSYPEFSMFGELPCWGLFVRHVKGLSMKNIDLKVREYDYRPAFVFDNVNDLELKRFRVKDVKETESVILRNVVNLDTDVDKKKIKRVK